MLTFLDAAAAAESVATVAKDIVQDPGKSTLAMLITLVGGIASIAGTAKYFAERTRKKDQADVAAQPGTGKPPPEDAPALIEMRELVAEARRESLEIRARAKAWREKDAEDRLAQLLPELSDTKAALVEARAMNAELLRVVESQRLLIAQQQLALDRSEDVLEVEPVQDDWAETTPPLARNPLLRSR
jgi:uncharacterized membrane protein